MAERAPLPRVARVAAPVLVAVLVLAAWQLAVRAFALPPWLVPSPRAVLATLVADRALLFASLWVTLSIALAAFALAVVAGVTIALAFAQSRWIEASFLPYAILLQVTPIVAIAPLIIIWVNDVKLSLLICAWIVAFFPILSNMVSGLKSVDHNLLNLFELNGASRWQTLIYLKLPSSLPYFASALRIGGGLSLIAAVVAEFAVGSAGRGSGLAFRLLESGYRLNYPRLYAALVLLMITGVAIFALTSFISWLLLHRWHESAVKREN